MNPQRRNLVAAAGVVTLAAAAGVGLDRLKHPGLAPLGVAFTDEALQRARDLLRRHPAVDAHAHPGRSFVHGAEGLGGLVWLYARLGTFEARTIAEMKAGGLAVASFAAVADFQTLGLQGEGLVARREFEPGEAWASYQRQMARLRTLATQGLVHPVLRVSDVAAARAVGKVGALWTVEGGDFLEGRPERVAQAKVDGVRSITLMHYRNNELGDITTGEARGRGLTPVGVAVVQAMNQAGLLIDVAHASNATALGVIAATRQPVMASHVHIHTERLTHPRFITRDLARAVADTDGGVVGAWPTGMGITDLQGFLDRTLELIDAVGVNHVCLGTDMDANYKPVFDTYLKLPHFVAGLLQRGLHEDEVARLIGGNFLRVLAAVQGDTAPAPSGSAPT